MSTFRAANKLFLRTLISQHTKLSRDHLTPELSLHLITPKCHLWHSRGDDSPFHDPYWAFYWPGGQALTRYILDNPALFNGKSVLDIGSGSGSAALASKLSGAATVVANDIDPVAAVAIEMNMEENGVLLNNIDTSNLLAFPLQKQYDIILLGDMFYDSDFVNLVYDWLEPIPAETMVLIGDPGRFPFINHPISTAVQCLMAYGLPETCLSENNGLTSGFVWRINKSR